MQRPALRAGALLAPALLTALVAGVALGPAGAPAARPPDMEDWDVRQLLQHLRDRGLGIRLVPVENTDVVVNRAYFTTTDKGWEDLDPMLKLREAIDRWEGTVYCERQHGEVLDAQMEDWGDCCLCVGPFLLFGDRALLRAIDRLCTR
jgi:hypothetical protein